MIRTRNSCLLLAAALGVLLALHTTAARAVELPLGLSPILHLDAFDPLGTGVQPADGSHLNTWVDLSGNGNDAPTSFGTPTYIAGDVTSIGAQPTLRYTTADGHMTTTSFADNSLTIFSVSKMTGPQGRLITGTPNNYLLGYHGDTHDTGFNGAWFGGSVGVTSNANMYIHEARNDGSDVLYNGSNVIANTRDAGGGTAISRVGLGGRNWSEGEASDGDISEFLIFDSDMSQEDFDAVGLYLAQKYGFEAFGHDGEVLGGGPVIPEPSSVVLAVLGILGLAATARRRRRRAAA